MNANKAIVKSKKKKSPGKGKKRRSSSTTDPDFVVRTPKRKAAKRDVREYFSIWNDYTNIHLTYNFKVALYL